MGEWKMGGEKAQKQLWENEKRGSSQPVKDLPAALTYLHVRRPCRDKSKALKNRAARSCPMWNSKSISVTKRPLSSALAAGSPSAGIRTA